MTALSWLASPAIQTFLSATVNTILVNSLDAERKGVEAKHWVSRKTGHVETVSRDLICARFHQRRLNQSLALAAAERKLKKAKKCQLPAVAWLRSGEGAEVGRPLGMPKTRPGTPATGGAGPATRGE